MTKDEMLTIISGACDRAFKQLSQYGDFANSEASHLLDNINSLQWMMRNLEGKEEETYPEHPVISPTLTPPPAEVPDQSELVQQQASRIRELFDLCKQQEEKIAELTSRLEAVPAATASAEAELEAYRRAERAERVAQERADQILQQVNSALADATVKVDEASALLGSMADQLSGQLDRFRSAVTGSKQALEDAAATMYAIRPSVDTQ